LVIGDSAIDLMRYQGTTLARLEVSRSKLKRLECLKARIQYLSIDCGSIDSLEIAGSGVDLWSVTDSVLANVDLSSTEVVKIRIRSSKIVWGLWAKVKCTSLVCEDSLMLFSSGGEIEASTIEFLQFENCIFLDCGIDQLLKMGARFRGCTFLGCRKSDANEMERLHGCRGFLLLPKKFDKDEVRFCEREFPEVWTMPHWQEVSRNSRDNAASLAAYLGREFPPSGARGTHWSVAEVKERVARVEAEAK
jgi:hypothetical protein